MKLTLIDNRDSFTFNLVDAFRLAGAEVEVLRNSVDPEIALARAAGGAIILSPGPGTPAEAGCCLELIALAKGELPLIGICLGHQAIIEQAGGEVCRAASPVHGKVSALNHLHAGPFAGLPSPLSIGRYHSLCTPTAKVPDRFTVDADYEGMAMAVRDDAALQLGLQFHPESILTPRGQELITNLLRWAAQPSARAAA